MKQIAFAMISLALLVALAGAGGNIKQMTGIDLSGLGGATQTGGNGNIKHMTGVNFEGLEGVAQNEESNIKYMTGVNFKGLGGAAQTEGSNIKPILGVNFEGLGGESQSEASTPDTSGMVNVSESSMVVYVGGSSIPLGTYQNTLGKYFWIENGMEWSQYVSILQYSSLSLIAYTPTGGQGEIFEMYPGSALQGVYKGIYYNFNPGYNRIMYRGDVTGRHHLMFTINDEPSNGIIIDVTGGPILGSSHVLGTSP